jgi:DNA-binding transcriptional ArsR family regulator
VFTAQFSLSHACFLLTYPIAGWVGAGAGQFAAAITLALVATLAATTAARVWPVTTSSSLEAVTAGGRWTMAGKHISAAESATPSLVHSVAPDQARLDAAAGAFRMLADATRLHILAVLLDGEADVTALTEACGASRTAISQHLAKLRFTGLVDTRREGRRIIYRIHDGHLARLVREGLNLADHIVTGEPLHA